MRGTIALLTLLALPATAATYISDSITFPSGSIAFATDTFGFSSGPIGFTNGPIGFPSEPIQTETAETIEITLPADVLFDFDKAEIRPAAQAPLREIADLIRSKARGPVAINGYTDALGNDAYNQKLSERRAAAVKTWLATRENLARTPFTTAGYGPRNPVAPNRKPDGADDPDGRQLNRRVTLIIRK